jgi:microcystin-dependent protein
MPLLIPYDLGGLEPRVREAIDNILAPLQTWAGRVDGVNADERLNQLATGITGLSTVPTGAGFQWFTDTPPTGYLICDGSAVSRTTYANLFGVMGTAFGSGNGSSTFNLPDLRQRFPLGKAASGTGATLGETGGSIDHRHTGPSHTHTITGSTANATAGVSGSTGSAAATISGSTANESTHTHTLTLNSGTATLSTNDVFGAAGVDELLSNVSQSDHGHSQTTTSAGSAHNHSAGSLSVDSHSHSDGSLSVDAHGHGAGTLATAADGTGNTGTANPPFLVVHWIVTV